MHVCEHTPVAKCLRRRIEVGIKRIFNYGNMHTRVSQVQACNGRHTSERRKPFGHCFEARDEARWVLVGRAVTRHINVAAGFWLTLVFVVRIKLTKDTRQVFGRC